jgi:hypothetical protein
VREERVNEEGKAGYGCFTFIGGGEGVVVCTVPL